MSTTENGSSSMLSVRGLRLEIGRRILADHIDFDVQAGQLWCVLGPNGSGKSTLLHVLAGLGAMRTGTVTFGGFTWAQWGRREAARLRGLLLQRQSYAFSASVEECVLLGRHPHVGTFGWLGAHDRRCARTALQHLDLVALAARDVLTLSGGERQRVAVATLLAQDPALLLLDEPTTYLDLAHQAALFGHLGELARDHRRSVVFSTHDFNLAARFATHALILYGDGRVLAGTAAQLLQAQRLSELFGFALGVSRAGSGPVFVPQW